MSECIQRLQSDLHENMEALCARLKKLAVQLEGLSTPEASNESRGVLEKGLLALMELKSVFRTVCLATEEVGPRTDSERPWRVRLLGRGAHVCPFQQERQRTEAAKVLLDQAQLVMQNILYEKSFYLTETRAILDYPCAPCSSVNWPGPPVSAANVCLLH